MSAEHGLQPLELLEADGGPSVDVVLLDLEMPELDGYETLTRIKSDERLRHLPVIVISSVEDLDSVIRCIKIGATDYLPKPFNPELLGARLNASLAEKRLHDLEWSACNRSAASWTRRPPSRPRRSSRTASTPSPSGATRSGQIARVFQRMAREVVERPAPEGAGSAAPDRDRRGAGSPQGRGDHRYRLLP